MRAPGRPFDSESGRRAKAERDRLAAERNAQKEERPSHPPSLPHQRLGLAVSKVTPRGGGIAKHSPYERAAVKRTRSVCSFVCVP